MATVGTAMFFASAAILLYDQFSERVAMRRDLSVLTEIMAFNSTAALSFGDQKAATELLSSLSARPHVTIALLYAADHRLFATYRRDQWPGDSIVGLRADRVWFEGDRLRLFKSITLSQQRIGWIYIESDLDALHDRLKRFTQIVLGIALIVSWLATLLSTRLQRAITDPIAHLAAVARFVSLDKNYRVRAIKSTDDDLGQLIGTFNEMLTEIERRDVELLNKQQHLEQQVQGRTAELSKTNSDLLVSIRKAEAASSAKS